MSIARDAYNAAIAMAEGARKSGTRMRFAGEIRHDGSELRALGEDDGEGLAKVVRVHRLSARFELRREGGRAWTKEWFPVLRVETTLV